MAEKDKEKFMISIIGEQRLDGQTDRIEVLTEGNYLVKKDRSRSRRCKGRKRRASG